MSLFVSTVLFFCFISSSPAFQLKVPKVSALQLKVEIAGGVVNRQRSTYRNSGLCFLRSTADNSGIFAPTNAPHFVLLPGFGNADVDYKNPFGAGERASIMHSLTKRGFYVHIMPLQLARNFLSDASEKAGENGIIVVGHSAGGWLGRAIIGDGTWMLGDGPAKQPNTTARQVIKGLVTLGAPHYPPPPGQPDIMDMTRGALTWTDENLPGSHLSEEGLTYLTVASGGIVGDPTAPRDTREYAASQSYRLVCGDGAVPGDGVVPLVSAHLEGATRVTLDCYHSISRAVPGSVDGVRGAWYGSDTHVDAWLGPLLAARGLVPAPAGR